MARPLPQWQLQAKAAHRRDTELRRAEELKKVANYFEYNTNRSRHHEQWTTEGYYERANKEAEKLSAQKLKAIQLEERRKKLELMLFQENMEFQQEIKALAGKPKLYKNGSYLNDVPTSLLKDINQGFMDKEEQLRRQEAELRLHHAWRLRQPELRAATAYMANGRLKSAWTQQIVEKEIERKKEEEENLKILQERDEALRKQIELEQARMKEKELQMRELRGSLEEQIAELSEKETIVKRLQREEERELMILHELKFISSEREKEHTRLVSERDATIVNMGLHKYKLKKKVLSVIEEIELDLKILEKLQKAILKDIEASKEKSSSYKRILDAAMGELKEEREREQQRRKNIDAMYDGEARQINEKQDKFEDESGPSLSRKRSLEVAETSEQLKPSHVLLWAKEREARARLMEEVLSTLRRQVEDKVEASRRLQRANVAEREGILTQMESFHQQVRSKERDTELTNAAYSNISALQSQLNGLTVQKQQLEAAAEKEAELREASANERKLRHEIAKINRDRTEQAWV